MVYTENSCTILAIAAAAQTNRLLNSGGHYQAGVRTMVSAGDPCNAPGGKSLLERVAHALLPKPKLNLNYRLSIYMYSGGHYQAGVHYRLSIYSV